METHKQSNDRPLAGKRIVITRAPEQARELIEELEVRGAEVSLLPLVSFSDPLNLEPLDRAIRSLRDFDWLLFTSQNAAQFFAKRCRALDRDPRQFKSSIPSSKLQIAAVGSATKVAAEAEGFRVDVIATKAQGASLASELSASVQGCQVLLPRSDMAADDLPNALRIAGAQVTEVVAYRTMAPPIGAAGLKIIHCMMRSEIDVVIFASPSAFQHLGEAAGFNRVKEIASKVAFAAIGATTAKAIGDRGCRVAIEAGVPTAAGLAAAIEQYYEITSEKVN